jgi:hypothetical protein
MQSQSRTPRFQVTRPSSLKKTVAPRNVGAEATKPKPGPKKVALPTYEQQDQEQGEADGSSSEGEDVQDEMAPVDGQIKSNLAPSKQKTATVQAQDGPSRPKATKRPAQDGVPANPLTDGASLAPHMKMLSLTSGNKSVLAKVNGYSFYIPFVAMFTYVNQAIGSLLVNKKAVQEAHPLYNTIFSRTAIFYLVHIQILRCREFANVITDDELKVLKRFRSSYDFNKIVIPGPYVLLFQSIGICTPTNKRFLPTIPAFPQLDALIDAQGTGNIVKPARNAWTSCLGFLPYLIGMSSLLATKASLGEEAKMKKSDDSDEKKLPLNFDGRYFVPFHRDRKNKNDFLGSKMQDAPTYNSAAGFFASGSSFCVPFPDSLTHLKNVYEAVPPVRFPSHTSGRKMTRLIDYFYLDKDVSFLGVLFETLAIEARFFEGMTTFENIDVETGNQVNCVRHVILDGPSIPEGLEWFEPTPVLEDGITTESRVSDISDTDLQLATYSSLITKFSTEGTAANNTVLNFNSTDTDGETHVVKNSGTIYHEGVIKRRIPRQNPFTDEIRTHIYTSMMYDLSTVL